jgi:predicted phage terminase large subunit-like protein
MLLDYEDSRAFLIGTPRGFIDKTGNESQYYAMFKNASNKDPKYQCFQYSSYDNPFLKRDDIEELEKEVPPNLRLQELQGQFVNESEMQIFRPSWWQLTEVLPSPHDISKKFISIDTAFGVKDSNDESAATVWYKTFSGLFYCIHLWHDRVDYPALVSKIKELIVMYVPDNVVIENKASGQSLVQTLKVDLSHIAVTAFEPVGDKVQRATSITSFLEAGKVFLLKSHWNNDLINQATIFPMGTHDDIIDTISQALLWARIWDDKTQKIVSRSTYMAPKNEVSRFSEKSGMDISMARGFL